MDRFCQSPLECFSLFFGDVVFDFLTKNTNEYAMTILSNFCLKLQITPNSLYKTWKPVTVRETKGFIATILNMGIVKLPDLKDYWSTDVTTNLPFFLSVFSDFFQYMVCYMLEK